jgi:hypothetical protein
MRLCILALTVFCAAAVAGQQPALTIDDVTKMVQAGVAKDLILKTIADSPVPFQLNPDQLIALKKAGVPDEIVRAMTTVGHGGLKRVFHEVRFSSLEQGGPSGDGIGVPAGSKIYIATRDGFDTYLTAALRKSKVPLVVVSEKDKADYEFSGIPSEHSAVKLVNVKTHEVVFAYTITKKDAKHGPQTIAEACAQHIKEGFAGE